MKFSILIAVLLLSYFPNANAIQIKCGSQNYIADNVSFNLQTHQLTLATGTSFVVSGHPLNFTVKNAADQSVCQVDQPEAFFRMIAPAQVQSVLLGWDKWVHSKPTVCGEAVEAEAYVQPGAKKVALVIHGFASNPARMHDIVAALLDVGYDVLVPRLSLHFDTNLRDLDQAKYMDWVNDANAAKLFATRLSSSLNKSSRITLAGYSMGGTLAAWLALHYKNENIFDRLILVAPAWRVSTAASAAAFLLNTSYNDHYAVPESCTVDGSYIPTHAAQQVQELASTYIEGNYDGNKYDNEKPNMPTAYQRITIPQIMFIGQQDEAIDIGRVEHMCRLNLGKFCTAYEIPGQLHGDMLTALKRQATVLGQKASGSDKTMGQLLRDFARK